jgi:hypothetical protein
MSTIAESKVFLIARFHNHFLVSITMSFFLSQMFFFGLVDQTLHLGCTQCVVIMHDTDIWFQFAPVHWFLSSFCRNNRSKPRGKEEVELPCAGPYFGNALTLVLYLTHNFPVPSSTSFSSLHADYITILHENLVKTLISSEVVSYNPYPLTSISLVTY